MTKRKAISKPIDSSKKQDGRRSFILKAGAAVSAVAASAAVGLSKTKADPEKGPNDEARQLSNKIGRMEDSDSIRRLHQQYESLLAQGRYEEVVDLFAANAEVMFNGDLFTGKKEVRRLYCDLFQAGFTGKRLSPDPAQKPEVVEVAEDRKSAKGQFPYCMQVGKPMTGKSSLIDMARLQGEGVIKWREAGIHETSFVKEGNNWKIRRLEHKTS